MLDLRNAPARLPMIYGKMSGSARSVSFLVFFCLLFVAPPCCRKKNHCVVCEQIFLMKGLIEKKTKKMKLLSTSDWPLPSHSCLRPVTQSIRGEKMEAGEGGGPRLPLAQMGFH